MKRILAALMLTAAVASPAMAQTYVQSNGMSAPVAQPYMGYGAYTYAPGWDSPEVNNAAFAIDPDPSVRTQLQIQSDLTDR
jgi:hypothetical protein